MSKWVVFILVALIPVLALIVIARVTYKAADEGLVVVDTTAIDPAGQFEDHMRAMRLATPTEPAKQPERRKSQVNQPRTTAPIIMGTGACGGDLPPCSVLARESGGNLRAISPVGMCGTEANPRRCYGKWQFDLPTWNNYAGIANPIDASEDVQDAKARELWAGGRGCRHWGPRACGAAA